MKSFDRIMLSIIFGCLLALNVISILYIGVVSDQVEKIEATTKD